MTDVSPDPNIYDTGTEARGIPGYDSLRARVGDVAGSHRLGMSVWDLAPGCAAYPFHFHYVEEELLVVLEGTPMLRGASGWRRLARGAVVSFLPGPDGAHQIYNDGEAPVRFIAISTSGAPDIVSYPEQDKIGVFERPPGDGKLFKLFPVDAEVHYAEGIEPPVPPPAG
ncbi:MAG: cupin domain-containing protein [Solirubrobacteraceae bacterium]|nr:cupin domain-containing protein [Solirubrobacteraceae bacterium]